MFRALAFVLLLMLLTIPAVSATYYLDATRGDDANDGRTVEKAWKSLAKANAALQPGDTVFLRGGRYEGEWLSPAYSGKEGAPITYTAFKGEGPELTGGRYGCIVYLDNKSYITVRGLRIHDATEHDWVVRISGKDAHHNHIEQCDISDPQGYAPVVIAFEAHDNTIIDCTIHDTGHGAEGSGDCVVLNNGAHHNTITRNRCYNGCHSQIMAQEHLQTVNELRIVPGASHLFEEPGTLEQVAATAADWFSRYLGHEERHLREGRRDSRRMRLRLSPRSWMYRPTTGPINTSPIVMKMEWCMDTPMVPMGPPIPSRERNWRCISWAALGSAYNVWSS